MKVIPSILKKLHINVFAFWNLAERTAAFNPPSSKLHMFPQVEIEMRIPAIFQRHHTRNILILVF